MCRKKIISIICSISIMISTLFMLSTAVSADFAQNFTPILQGCSCSGTTSSDQHRYYAYNFSLNGTTVTFSNSHPRSGGTVFGSGTLSRWVVVSSVYPDSLGQGAPIDSSTVISGVEGGACSLTNLDTTKQYFIYTVAIEASTGRTWLDGTVYSTPLYCQPPVISMTTNGLSPNYPVVSWAAVSGAASYKIECATDEAFTQNKLTYTTTSTSYTLSALTWGTNYYVRVMTVAPSGSVDSGWSNIVTALNKKTDQLSAPSLSVSTLTYDKVNVSVGSVTYATSYLLQYSISSSFSPYLTATVSAGSNTIPGLTPNTTYYFRVQASSSNERYTVSGWSTVRSTKTAKYPLDTPVITKIDTLDANRLSVEFDKVDHATSYIIEYSADSLFSSKNTLTVT